MPTTPLLPLPDGLEIISIGTTGQELQIRVESLRKSSCCPRCSTPSSAVHSYYRRKPLELPCAGKAVRLLLTVRKFFCRVETCPQKVFTERLPGFLQPSSRLTTRLRTVVQAIASAFNAQGGARLGVQLGFHLSRTTFLRSLLRAPVLQVGRIEHIGVDDFAWRRGTRYGTVIVDLDSHHIIDVLPDREAKSVQSWLERHSTIGVISRDRGGVYVDGATWGAPLAQQVADRWHVCKNLGEAVEQFLMRTHTSLLEEPGEATKVEAEPAGEITPASGAGKGKTQAYLLRKWKLTLQIQELHQSGMSLRQIAEELDLARGTVRKYVRQPTAMPQPKPRPLRTSLLDPYEEYLLERWSQGCHNGMQLFREIQEKGFQGKISIVKAYMTHLRTSTKEGQAPRARSKRAEALSPRELRWLLMHQREKLDQKDQARLDQLLTVSADVQTIYTLAQSFLEMMRQRKGKQLRAWIEEANRSGIAEMKSFVGGIERDYDAVQAGLTLPWSQGPVEGAVNKIKTQKRLMYGRASFKLLRQKLLHQAGSS